MKTKILEALTTKFEGVNSKILDAMAEKLSRSVSTEEEVATAVEGVTFQSLLEMYGDQRANSASVTAVSNYEKKHGLKEGKPIEEPKPIPSPAPPAPAPTPTPKPQQVPTQTSTPTQTTMASEKGEMPEYVKQILEANRAMADSIKSLQGEIATIKTNKVVETRKAILEQAISKLSAAQQNPYKRINLDSMKDDEFSAFMDEVKGDVTQIEKDKAAAAAAVGRPYGSNVTVDNKKASKEELDAIVGKIMQ